jgi:hypothetical protein
MVDEIVKNKGFKGLDEPEIDSLPGVMPVDARGLKPIRQGGYRWIKGILRVEVNSNQVNVDGIRARQEKK